MKFKQFLDEEYVGSFNAGEGVGSFRLGYTEIFKNPSLKEMKSVLETSPWWEHIKNSCRFIIDFKRKNLYVFKPTTYHSEAARFLADENELLSDKHNDDIIWGEAELTGGYLKFIGSDSQVDFDDVVKNHGKTEGWTKRWFKPSFLASVENKDTPEPDWVRKS